MLKLNNVTAIIVDCVDLHSACYAMRQSCSKVQFAACKILTSLDTTQFRNIHPNIQFIKIRHLNNIEAYSEFMVKNLNDYVDTEFCLVMQWDGYVLNENAWREEFLQYDYIGAISDTIKILNGGFSLRSKKLLELVQTYSKAIPPQPEDIVYTYIAKSCLSLAPCSIGNIFSTERLYDQQFGFHNFRKVDFEFYNQYYDREKIAVHSGNIGDMIYAMPTIEKLGVKKLILNLREREWTTQLPYSNAQSIKPLLETKGIEVQIQYGYDPTILYYNLDKWRIDANFNNHLLDLQLNKFGIKHDRSPFINVKANGETKYDILVNRTQRYHNAAIDYNMLLKDFTGSIGFIGHEHEYKLFKLENRLENIVHIQTQDMLEVAKYIKNCKLFIGNESSPFAIAEGLNHPRILEIKNTACFPLTRNGFGMRYKEDLLQAKSIIDNLGV